MKKNSPWPLLLRAHREKVRINQDDFAKRLGVSQALVSRYERGKTIPPLELLTVMCEILDLTGDERASFVEEACLAHAPDRVRAIVTELRAEVARSRRLLAKYDAQFPGLK